jgi:hypothetical protein
MLKRIASTMLVIGALALASTTQSVPIFGEINFSGSLSTDTTSLATANVLIFNSAEVESGTGDYSLIPDNEPATFSSPFSIDPFAPVPTFWTLTDSGITYSFDLTSLSVTQIPAGTAGSLILLGTGIAHITGFDDTFGSFFLSSSGLDGATTFSFQASTNVPEPGTVALLGLGLLGLAGWQRRR